MKPFHFILDKPPVIAQRFPTKETVKVGQNWTMNCPVVGTPHPAVDWLKDGRIIHESDRITIHRGMCCLYALKNEFWVYCSLFIPKFFIFLTLL